MRSPDEFYYGFEPREVPETPYFTCPNCGEYLYEGDKAVYVTDANGKDEVVGCESCGGERAVQLLV